MLAVRQDGCASRSELGPARYGFFATSSGLFAVTETGVVSSFIGRSTAL
jgi:hypothetical protein